MEKEKVVIFLDYANIHSEARKKRYELDFADLLSYMGEDRFVVDAHCYVPINPRNEHRLDGVIDELWRSGFIVNTKRGNIAGETYKCNFDVEITMDVLKTIYHVKPDIIVLATGDSDFVPLIQEVRKSGVRVEVAAFVENAGTDIMLKSSGFIDLAVYYEDYLATQNGQQRANSIDERYQKLIQSQNAEQDEESEEGMEDKISELIQSQGSEMDKDEEDMDDDEGQEEEEDEEDIDVDDIKVAVDQEDDEAVVPGSDVLDELGL